MTFAATQSLADLQEGPSGRGGRRTAGDWTEERIDLLKKLWADGLSATQVAGEIGGGFSRNAIIGKVHRLGLGGRSKPPGTSAPRQRRRRAHVATVPKAVLHAERIVEAAALRDKLAAEASAPSAPATDTAVRSILDLKDDQCRWPIGDPRRPGFHYCGAPRLQCDPPASYCAEHTRIAYPPRSRE